MSLNEVKEAYQMNQIRQSKRGNSLPAIIEEK